MVTAAPHVTFDSTLTSSLIVQFVLSGLGMLTNGAVLICLIIRPGIRTQPNFLVANLSGADFLLCVVYGILASINWNYSMEPAIGLCMCIVAPTLFALNMSLCCSVAITHHRSNCCLLGYSSVHGVGAIAERWKLKAAAVSVWCLTFLGGAIAFIDIGAEGAMPICIYPVALHNSYLVPYTMFICCVAGVAISEHIRVLSLLIYAFVKKPFSEKPSPKIILSTFFILIVFCLCWTPMTYASILYLHPGAGVFQEVYYIQAQWLCTMPLVHASLVDPVVYALSERDYAETLAGLLLALCPFSFRWHVKWRMQRFGSLANRRRRALQRQLAGSSVQDDGNAREKPAFSISSVVIEMSHVVVDLPVDKDQSGHINHAYGSGHI